MAFANWLTKGFMSRNGKKRTVDRLTLYLHIGLPKTGSSSIQSFLFHNRLALRKHQGIIYPDMALHWAQHVPVVKAIVSSCFDSAHFNKAIPSIDLGAWQAELIEQCKTWKCHKIILSSEFFWAAPAMQSVLEFHEDNRQNFGYIEKVIQECRSVFSGFDTIKVIVYLRKQNQWLESFFNHQIKDGFAIPCEKDLLPAKNYMLYYKNLRLWAHYFGEDNIIVRTYETSVHDVVRDFCEAVTVRMDDSLSNRAADIESANPRLSPRALQIMRVAIEKKLDREVLSLLREVLINTSSAFDSSRWMNKNSVFSEQFHEQIVCIYKDDNIRLAERYPTTAHYSEKEEYLENISFETDLGQRSSEEQVEQLLERIMPLVQEA